MLAPVVGGGMSLRRCHSMCLLDMPGNVRGYCCYCSVGGGGEDEAGKVAEYRSAGGLQTLLWTELSRR